MVSLISTGSNYIIVIMGVIYAITCFTVFLPSTEKRQVQRMDRQELFMFVFHFICYGVLFAKTLDTKIIFLYLAQVVFFKMLIFVYSRVCRLFANFDESYLFLAFDWFCYVNTPVI